MNSSCPSDIWPIPIRAPDRSCYNPCRRPHGPGRLAPASVSHVSGGAGRSKCRSRAQAPPRRQRRRRLLHRDHFRPKHADAGKLPLMDHAPIAAVPWRERCTCSLRSIKPAKAPAPSKMPWPLCPAQHPGRLSSRAALFENSAILKTFWVLCRVPCLGF